MSSTPAPSLRPRRLVPTPPVLVRAVIVAASVSTAFASAQTFAPFLGLAGPVHTVHRYQEYPGTTERRLVLTRTFAEDGTPVELVTFAYSFMDGALTARNVTNYDDEGRVLASVRYDAEGGVAGQTAFRYDEAQRIVEQVTYDAEGNETRRVTYERDESGNAVVEETYTGGALFRRAERTFDGEGHGLEERRFDGDGHLVEVRTQAEPGVQEIVTYDAEGAIEGTGRIVEGAYGTEFWVGFDEGGESTFEFTYTYDEAGRLVERREVYGDDATVYTYSFELDPHGSWIRQTVLEDAGDGPEPYEILDREIAYY